MIKWSNYIRINQGLLALWMIYDLDIENTTQYVNIPKETNVNMSMYTNEKRKTGLISL